MASNINAETRICGSIARHASSLGAAMYNAAYEKLGLNFVYLPFSTADTEGAIRAMRALGFRGLAAADPHNVRVASFLDDVDPVAERIGSVNTILNDGGILRGYNSDWIGFKTAFEEVAPILGRKVVVLGAGGACQAVAYALVASKSERIMILNRTPEKSKHLAERYGLESGSLDLLPKLADYDTLINTTSVGSFNNPVKEIVVEEKVLHSYAVVADIVFSPVETPLIAKAKRLGKATMAGWRMLLHQGMFQFKLFTGVEPPVEFIGDILYRGLTSR